MTRYLALMTPSPSGVPSYPAAAVHRYYQSHKPYLFILSPNPVETSTAPSAPAPIPTESHLTTRTKSIKATLPCISNPGPTPPAKRPHRSSHPPCMATTRQSLLTARQIQPRHLLLWKFGIRPGWEKVDIMFNSVEVSKCQSPVRRLSISTDVLFLTIIPDLSHTSHQSRSRPQRLPLARAPTNAPQRKEHKPITPPQQIP